MQSIPSEAGSGGRHHLLLPWHCQRTLLPPCFCHSRAFCLIHQSHGSTCSSVCLEAFIPARSEAANGRPCLQTSGALLLRLNIPQDPRDQTESQSLLAPLNASIPQVSMFWIIRFSLRTVFSESVKSFSRVRLLGTPWAVALQAPLSLRFSRQEYCSGLRFPTPGDFPHPGIELASPTLKADSLLSEPPGKPRLSSDFIIMQFPHLPASRFLFSPG